MEFTSQIYEPWLTADPCLPYWHDDYFRGCQQSQVLAQGTIYSTLIIRNNLESSLIQSFTHEIQRVTKSCCNVSRDPLLFSVFSTFILVQVPGISCLDNRAN